MTWRTLLTAHTSSGPLLKLGTLAALGLGMALSTGACSFSAGSDGEPTGGTPSGGKSGGTGGAGDTGGSGGTGNDSSTGGETASGGSGSGGEANTGGSGGTIEPSFDCHDGGGAEGTLASTELTEKDDECWACIKTSCPDAFAECHAIVPHSVCGWDGFGEEDYGGEIDCMIECFDTLVDDGEFLGTDDDVSDCAAECGASTCATGEVTSVTYSLASCAIAAEDIADFGCQAECGWLE